MIIKAATVTATFHDSTPLAERVSSESSKLCCSASAA